MTLNMDRELPHCRIAVVLEIAPIYIYVYLHIRLEVSTTTGSHMPECGLRQHIYMTLFKVNLLFR